MHAPRLFALAVASAASVIGIAHACEEVFGLYIEDDSCYRVRPETMELSVSWAADTHDALRVKVGVPGDATTPWRLSYGGYYTLTTMAYVTPSGTFSLPYSGVVWGEETPGTGTQELTIELPHGVGARPDGWVDLHVNLAASRSYWPPEYSLSARQNEVVELVVDDCHLARAEVPSQWFSWAESVLAD